MVEATKAILGSVPHDWDKYAKHCDTNMTCFEPEAVGYLAKGLPFHKFYFDLLGGVFVHVCVCVSVCLCVCVSVSVCL